MGLYMSKKVKIGNLYVGGGESIAIQSMSTYKTADTVNAINDAIRLEQAGCDILRYSVTDLEDAKAFAQIKKQVKIN